MTKLKINEAQFFQDFEALRQIGLQPDGAVHRVAYSATDWEGREWLNGRLRSYNLDPELDAAGNTTAVYAGTQPLPPIGIGSHTDTVPHGGAYDGALGVVAALAVIDALHKANVRLRHPIELINFAAEEATMAGGTTGSQAMTGLFAPPILNKKAWDGQLVREHLSAVNLNPDQILNAQREVGSLAAFVELHIEQSDLLEKTAVPIAIVDSFVGIRRYAVTFRGVANHAGTTPMSSRQDALVMAAPLVRVVQNIAVELGIVGTIGDFSVYPGAPNVIPERVELIVEIRGGETAVLDQAAALIEQEAVKLGGAFTPVVQKPPVQTDPRIREAITAACEKLGLATLTMPSGAGHDAMNMSHICPQGIFFVPSKGGVSHSKEEFTTPEDCLNGAQLYLETILHLDQTL